MPKTLHVKKLLYQNELYINFGLLVGNKIIFNKTILIFLKFL